MYLDSYTISIPAESKEEAIETLKENLVEEDMEYWKLDFDASIDTKPEFDKSESIINMIFTGKNFWNSINVGFTASEYDKEIAERMNESVNGSINERARTYKVDDRGRITLGSNYADKDEVNAVIVHE